MINIITGRQSDPLQNEIIDLAVSEYNSDSNKQIFIIIPNHIKFTTEVKALSKLANLKSQNQIAVKNLQILSFSRLAWYFLRDSNIKIPEILDDSTSLMLLEQIVREKQDQLELFKEQQINHGALSQLYEAILLVRQGSLDLNELDLTHADEETKLKMHDLRIVYDEFIERLANKFATKDEMQLLLNQFLAEHDLKEASFYFSDFSHFSNQELLSLKLISKKANNLVITFKTKDGQVNSQPETGDYDYIVQSTIRNLEYFWQNQNLDYSFSPFSSSNKIDNKTKLNAVWTHTIPQKGIDLSSYIQPVKADSRYAEAYYVVRTIYQQVALNNYRYQDFLVLAPNLSEYETYLVPILRQNKIPFFDDLQKQMRFHPLVILIENLYQIYKKGFVSENILALMKTHLLIPDSYPNEITYQYDIDELENFVLAHGINNNLWKKDFNSFIDAKIIKLDDSEGKVEQLNDLKEYFINNISNLISQLKTQSDPKEALTIFWDFLIKNGVAKQLEKWRQKASDDQDLQLAAQPEQVWSTLNQLLKDYLLLASEFDIESFFDLIIAGFSEASFSQIPSSLDAVNVSEIGMVQTDGYKQVFVLGATSNNLPQIEKIPGFFTSENIEQINSNLDDKDQLEDAHEVNNLDQDYQFGNVLSLASDKIYISYPVLNSANEELNPSIYYKRLVDISNVDEFFQHDLPHDTQDILTFITNPEASLGYLTYLRKENISGSKEIIKLTEEDAPQLTKQVLLASEFKNIPHELSAELAQNLYGLNIETSVSQLETFYENSFEYFLNYGLHLRKRFENELDVVQAGNYYHETFDRLVKLLKEKNLDLSQISQKEMFDFLRQIHDLMQEKGEYRQLLTDPFNKYLFHKLDQTTNNVAKFWQANLKKTAFRPNYSELSFGRNQEVKGLGYNVSILNKDHHIDLRGKMDRVDLAQVNDHVLGQVIDYKSSSKKFDLGLFANGISLQMVSYLDVLRQNKQFFAQDEDLEVLGAFYQTVTQHLEKLNSDTNITSEFQLKDIVKETNKKLMYNGILIENPQLIEKVEPDLKKDQAISELYKSLKKKKNGDFSYPSTSSFTPDELDKILSYNAYLVKNAAKSILSGQVELNPYLYNKKTPLQYSEFKDIFFFDAMLKENSYHKISGLNKKQLIEFIDKKLNLEKGEEDG